MSEQLTECAPVTLQDVIEADQNLKNSLFNKNTPSPSPSPSPPGKETKLTPLYSCFILSPAARLNLQQPDHESVTDLLWEASA